MYIGDEHSDFKNVDNTAECQLLKQTTYDNLAWTCKLYSFGLISQNATQNISASCGYNFLFDTGSITYGNFGFIIRSTICIWLSKR